jgi:cell division protein FtsL
MRPVSKRMVLLTAVFCACALMLGLTLVWLNMERVHMAYELKKLQAEVNNLEDHAAKLMVERDNLLSPYRLRELAAQYGLEEAGAGQIRMMGPDDEQE